MFIYFDKKLAGSAASFFLLIVLTASQLIHPGDLRVNLDLISNENGLSQNTIHFIMQDSKGFIWFATEDGLNRYDGYNFTIYKNNPQDKNSIPDNFIWTILEDHEHNLWIGTNNGGLSKFDRLTEKFINYSNNPADPGSLSFNNVRAICEDKQGNIWVGTETGGLDMFDKKRNIFIHNRHSSDPQSLSNDVVLSIHEDKDGVIWAGTDVGLNKLNPRTGKFLNYTADQQNENSLTNNIVLSIFEDSQGIFWIGTFNGLTRFDKRKNEFKKLYIDQPYSQNASSNRINTILEDKQGVMWIGTGGGLYQFNRKSGTFDVVTPIYAPSSLLTNKNILSLFEDNSGLFWIGSAEDGAAKYDRERMKFRHYKHDIYTENSLSHNTVRAIFQDEKHIIWIGTLGGGLNKYNPADNSFVHYKNNPSDKNSLSDNSVSAIFKDSYGFLWVGTWNGGLNKSLTPVNKSALLKFLRYRNVTSTYHLPRSNIIQSIFEDSHKNLWIGTGEGLSLFDRKTNDFINFTNDPSNSSSISSNLIQSCIFEDKKGNIWIGTWGGLNKISSANKFIALKNPRAVKFIHYTFKQNSEYSLSDNRVISAYEDKDGNLWFGTYGGGLNMLSANQYEAVSPKFINYNVSDGMPSNIVYSIQGDNNGNIWISTDNGLAVLNRQTAKFKNYDVNDGLQGNQFFWGAGCKGTNGELYFGGTNGFNVFNPAELKINEHIPPIVITNFQIFNRPVKPGSDNSPLQYNISETKEIELTYSQNVFSFEFASLDFSAPAKNRYEYMMEGFDEVWINSDNRRFVTYTNLNPGEYIFRVRGSNSDGVWNQQGTAIIIKILPPLWMTWWFIVLTILTLGGIIAYLITYRVKHLLNIERFRAKLAADLHDNIGSSLTEISIWSEIIRNKIHNPDKDVEKSLRMISNNSRNLIDSMSDIVWLVNPKRDSLYDLILRLRDTYSELSSYTSISFKSENIKALEKVTLSIEHRQHLYLIFKEAINNCITHSSCTEISLDAFVKGKKLEMILADNGKGFNGVHSNGNGLENIRSRAKQIGGSLKISSEPGKGTVIKFEGNIL